MANNFYNMNIHRYNPAEHQISHSNAGNSNPIYYNPQESPNTLEEETLALFDTETQNRQLSHSRLNALDSTLLENEAYQNIDDEVFKTEYKINRLEEGIKNLNKEIESAKSINDFQKADILIMRRRSLESQLKTLNENYQQSDVSTKLSGEITSILKIKPTILNNAINRCVSFMSEKVLPKISKKFNSGKTIKTALYKLETLNKNVDEIVTTQVPYGEADERYDMLSDYLNRANVIHFKISQTVGTPTFFDTISSIDKEKLQAEMKKNHSNFGNMTGKPNQV